MERGGVWRDQQAKQQQEQERPRRKENTHRRKKYETKKQAKHNNTNKKAIVSLLWEEMRNPDARAVLCPLLFPKYDVKKEKKKSDDLAYHTKRDPYLSHRTNKFGRCLLNLPS
jgi:hypothetical protein